jgi:rhamnulose-1-phosphate aldolase
MGTESSRGQGCSFGLADLLIDAGQAGQRMAEINACEGGAGNLSALIGWPLEIEGDFTQVEAIALPLAVPALSGQAILVTGSGCRLRDLAHSPAANLGIAIIQPDGETALWRTHPSRRFSRPTSEFNSHLAVHADHVQRTGANFHALLHAQPPYLTYLSHIGRYQDEAFFNRRLLRWQPETIINFPEGLGVLPFMLPGSAQLMQANVASLRAHRLAVWCRHGAMARCDATLTGAADLIEYAEAAARYEYLNLVNHAAADGLSPVEIRQAAQAFGVSQTFF